MTQISYNNTIAEIKYVYNIFQRKYAFPRMIFMSVLLLITLILGIDFIIKNPSGYAGYILTAVSSGLIISMWLRPISVQKKLINTIEELCSEEYVARFYEDRIEIDTEVILTDEEPETVVISSHGVSTVENPEVLEEAEKKLIQPETSVYRIGTETLFPLETKEMFCLFVNKSLFHIFPKRCLSEEQTALLREYFKKI
ncbi:MAG: YcxB family protein [Oscillospiraceae bacterium]|nr:YcxB family protein [Oscillospiraceae bacterium]